MFVNSVQSATTVDHFERIITQYGTHLIWQLEMGGLLFATVQTAACFHSFNLAIAASVEAVSGTWTGSGSVEVDISNQHQSSKDHAKVSTYGGLPADYETWVASVRENPHMVGRQLLYVGHLIPPNQRSLWDGAMNNIRDKAERVVSSRPKPATASCPQPPDKANSGFGLWPGAIVTGTIIAGCICSFASFVATEGK